MCGWCARLLLFSQEFRKYYARRFRFLLEETGLTMREIHVLLFLINHPGCDTAREVTALRGLSKSQVSQAVELLAAEGLLRREPDREDRRVVRLSLTEAGIPLARRCQEIQASCGRHILAGLTEEEREQFLTLLGRVLDNGSRLSKEEEAVR